MKKSLLFSLALVPAAAIAGVVGANRQIELPAGSFKVESASEQLCKAKVGDVKKANLKANTANVVKPKADAEAGYVLPDGTFFWGWGMSSDGDRVTMKSPFSFAPCNVPLTWTNCSTGATSFTWTYPVDLDESGQNEITETSTDKDLVWTPPCFYMLSNPVLTAGSSSYQYPGYALYGGYPYMSGYSFAIFPDDYSTISSEDGAGYSYTSYWGASENTNNYYNNISIFQGKNPVLTSMYQFYPASSAPYVIESVNVRGYFTKYTSDKLIAKIWKINETGAVSALMYEGYIDGSEVPTDTEYYSTATIPFYETDGELESQVLAEISANTPILIEITGFDSAKDSFLLGGLYSPGDLDEDDATSSYFGVTYDGKNGRTLGIYDCGVFSFTGKDGGDIYFSLLDISTTMDYPYVAVDDDVLSFSTEGETKTLEVNSLFTSDYITVSGDGEGDWWSYEVGEGDTSTGLIPVDFTVAPLAEGVHKNWAMVNISTPGAGKVVYLIQDDGSSVDSVEAANTSAKVVNGNFEVESANATAVAVYNLAGQKVAEATFEGKATVAAADLAKGVYVLKFNNNVVVKLAK